MNRVLRLFALVAIFALAATACGSDSVAGSTGDATAGTTTGTTGDATGEDLVWHALLPETGPVAVYAGPLRYSVEVAVEDINADGGINGRMVSAVFHDDQSDPAQGATIVRQLADSELFILLQTSSTVAENAAAVANDLEVPLIAGATSNTSIFAANQPWTFTFFPEIAGAVGSAVNEWLDTTGATTVQVMWDGSGAQGRAQGEAELAAVESRDGAEAFEPIVFQTGDVDMSPLVTSAMERDPDAIAIGGSPNESIALVNEFKRQNYDGTIFIGRSSWIPQAIQESADAVEGVYSFDAFSSAIDTPAVQAFTQRVTEDTGNPPSVVEGLTYPMLLWLADELREGGYTFDAANLQREREQLRDAIDAAVIDSELLPGPLEMTGNGYPTGSSYLLVAEDGVMVPAGS